jgi:hypothetical protein
MLISADPPAWLALAGLPVNRPVRSVEAGLDTIRAQADAVLRVGRRRHWFLHVELQTGRDRRLPERIHRYNVLLFEREHRTIVSMVVLLRPRADGPEMTGEIERFDPIGRVYEQFRYHVVRAWQIPTESLLAGPLGTLPLAPLPELFAASQSERTRRGRVREVVEQIDRRLRAEAPPGRADELRVATHYLLGLRYSESVAEQLTRGVWGMWDSKTYRYAVETGLARGMEQGLQQGLEQGRQLGLSQGEAQGRAGEARRIVTRIAERRFGPAPATSQARLAAIDDVDALERLIDRLPDVQSWDELIDS